MLLEDQILQLLRVVGLSQELLVEASVKHSSYVVNSGQIRQKLSRRQRVSY